MHSWWCCVVSMAYFNYLVLYKTSDHNYNFDDPRGETLRLPDDERSLCNKLQKKCDCNLHDAMKAFK